MSNGQGRVGVAPGTIVIDIQPNGQPRLLNGFGDNGPWAANSVPGYKDGYPVSPMRQLPSQWQAAPYMGYLPAWTPWITPGLGSPDLPTLVGDVPLSGNGGTSLALQLAAVGVTAILTGLISYAAFRSSGSKKAVPPALIMGGFTAAVGTAGALITSARRTA